MSRVSAADHGDTVENQLQPLQEVARLDDRVDLPRDEGVTRAEGRPPAGLDWMPSASSIAAPVMQPQRHDGGGYSERVQHADSYWNHHRYHHRDWDRHHNRWRYYD